MAYCLQVPQVFRRQIKLYLTDPVKRSVCDTFVPTDSLIEQIVDAIISLNKNTGSCSDEIWGFLTQKYDPDTQEADVLAALRQGCQQGWFRSGTDLQRFPLCTTATNRYILNPDMDENPKNGFLVMYVLWRVGCRGSPLYKRWIAPDPRCKLSVPLQYGTCCC